jgi:hypothetical protein
MPDVSGRYPGLTFTAASARFMVLGCNSGCRLLVNKRGCTKHICGVGQALVALSSTATKVCHGVVTGSSSRPRNSAVPRRRPDAVIQKGGLIPWPPTRLLSGVGDAVRGVLVLARLDARAALAQSPPVRHVCVRATVRGPTKRKGVGRSTQGASRARRMTWICHWPSKSVAALSTRLVRVRPLVPQFGLQLSGPGLVPRRLLGNNHRPSHFPAFFRRRDCRHPGCGSRGGEKMRHR